MPERLLVKMVDSRELSTWMALERIRAEEQKEAERKQKMLARLEKSMSAQRGRGR